MNFQSLIDFLEKQLHGDMNSFAFSYNLEWYKQNRAALQPIYNYLINLDCTLKQSVEELEKNAHEIHNKITQKLIKNSSKSSVNVDKTAVLKNIIHDWPHQRAERASMLSQDVSMHEFLKAEQKTSMKVLLSECIESKKNKYNQAEFLSQKQRAMNILESVISIHVAEQNQRKIIYWSSLWTTSTAR